MGFYERYWEMQEGGPYSGEEGQDPANKVFKCTDCGAETHPRKGWNGEPDPGECHSDCPSRSSDWRPGRVSNAFRRGIAGVRFHHDGTGLFDLQKQPNAFKDKFDTIFPESPGSGT